MIIWLFTTCNDNDVIKRNILMLPTPLLKDPVLSTGKEDWQWGPLHGRLSFWDALSWSRLNLTKLTYKNKKHIYKYKSGSSGVARLWSQCGHRGSGGQKSPSGVQGRSLGGGLGPKPQKPLYIDSLQLSNAFLCRFVAESASISIGRGRVGTFPPVPTLGYATVWFTDWRQR